MTYRKKHHKDKPREMCKLEEALYRAQVRAATLSRIAELYYEEREEARALARRYYKEVKALRTTVDQMSADMWGDLCQLVELSLELNKLREEFDDLVSLGVINGDYG